MTAGIALHAQESVFEASAFEVRLELCTLYALRGERYKYVHFTAVPALLFDLQDDPAELVDRAGDPGYRNRTLEHAQKMLSWRMNHDERLLANVRLTPDGVVEHRPRRT